MVNREKKPVIEDHSSDTEAGVVAPQNYRRLGGASEENTKSTVTTQL